MKIDIEISISLSKVLSESSHALLLTYFLWLLLGCDYRVVATEPIQFTKPKQFTTCPLQKNCVNLCSFDSYYPFHNVTFEYFQVKAITINLFFLILKNNTLFHELPTVSTIKASVFRLNAGFKERLSRGKHP